jgi:hypothetical protein
MEAIPVRRSWNKGKFVGQKRPLKPKDIWAIRIYLQNAHAVSSPRCAGDRANRNHQFPPSLAPLTRLSC